MEWINMHTGESVRDIVVAKYENGIQVFGRSTADKADRPYGDVNLKETLIDKLVSYGGHAGAAGITVKKEDFPDMVAKMSSIMAGYEIPEQGAIQHDMEVKSNLHGIYQELAKNTGSIDGHHSIDEFKK